MFFFFLDIFASRIAKKILFDLPYPAVICSGVSNSNRY